MDAVALLRGDGSRTRASSTRVTRTRGRMTREATAVKRKRRSTRAEATERPSAAPTPMGATAAKKTSLRKRAAASSELIRSRRSGTVKVEDTVPARAARRPTAPAAARRRQKRTTPRKRAASPSRDRASSDSVISSDSDDECVAKRSRAVQPTARGGRRRSTRERRAVDTFGPTLSGAAADFDLAGEEVGADGLTATERAFVNDDATVLVELSTPTAGAARDEEQIEEQTEEQPDVSVPPDRVALTDTQQGEASCGDTASDSDSDASALIEETTEDDVHPMGNTVTVCDSALAFSALTAATAPKDVPCRERERDHLSSFVGSCLKRRRGGAIYVCGSPGTGKSACLAELQQRLRSSAARTRPRLLWVNGMSFRKPAEAFARLHSMVMGSSSRKRRGGGAGAAAGHVADLENAFAPARRAPKSSPMTVLVVDELEALLSGNDATALYRLFEWAAAPMSTLVLAGISNAIDLAERSMPRLAARGVKPELVVFEPYTAENITEIIKSRIANATSGACKVIDPVALDLLSRKVAKNSGDVRRALGLCRDALGRAGRECCALWGTDPQADHHDAGRGRARVVGCGAQRSTGGYIVGVPEMVATLNRAFASPTVERIQELPQHSQVLLFVIWNLSGHRLAHHVDGYGKDGDSGAGSASAGAGAGTKRKVPLPTIDRVHNVFARACRHLTMTSVAGTEFTNLLERLEDTALLAIGSSKSGGKHLLHSSRGVARAAKRDERVRVTADAEEVAMALEDSVFIKQLESHLSPVTSMGL